MGQSLKKFIEGMPKTELHVHIEGTFEPELAFALAEKNGITLRKQDGTDIAYKDAAELRADYHFKDLQGFLNLYYNAMSALKTEDDFYDLTMAYLKKIASQNVTHTEIFFDPQQHMANGIDFGTVMHGITKALKEAEETGIEVNGKKQRITSRLHMHFLRHLSEEDAFKALGEARKIDPQTNKPYLYQIDGFGLDSGEWDHPPSKFERLYMELGTIIDAKTGGPKALMMHAGEEGTAEYVRQAITILKAAADQLPKDASGKRRIRIDHGNHALDDPEVVQMMAEEGGIGNTVCPLSNLALRHKLTFPPNETRMTDLKQHTLKEMLRQKMKPSIHSDDPAYFGGYMNENFIRIAEALDLTRDDIMQLAQNAIDTSFLSLEQKEQKTQELNAYRAKFETLEQFVKQGTDQDQARRVG